jgi:hypothetical protein
VASAAPRDACEKFIARRSASGLDGLLGSSRQCGDVGPANLAFQVQLRGKRLDELCIGCARAATQSVIEMTKDKPPIAVVGEKM